MNLLFSFKEKILKIWKWFLAKPWRFLFILIFVFILLKILNGNGNGYEEIIVQKRDLARTVLSSGEVVSSVDLSLSFPKSGVVKEINVKVGDKVEKDQVLATLNQGTLSGTVTEALGALRSAEAKLQEVIEGATNEEIRLAEINLNSAVDNLDRVRIEQGTLVRNAERILNSTDLVANPDTVSSSGTEVYLTGSFTSNKTGTYSLVRDLNNSEWILKGPLNIRGSISELNFVPIADTGLFIKFSNEDFSRSYSWTIEIPNTQGENYKTNKANYDAVFANAKSLISSAENNVLQKESELVLKKKEARPSDVASAEASVLQARGRYQSALAELNDTKLLAPEAGTITSINIKTGELSEVQKVAMVLENTESLYVESNINEANIDLIYKDAVVEIDFDAFPGKKYFGKISFVEPSETLIGGVVNYKVNADILEVDPNIRPGLTANLLINIWNAEGVVTIPERAIFEKEGKYFVLKKVGRKSKNNAEVEVKKGRVADGAMIEILSGLAPDEIVLIKIEN